MTIYADGLSVHDRRRERRGWYLYDWANQPFSTTVVTVFMGPYLTSVAENAADADGYVHPLGLAIRAEAVFPFAVSISVILQVAFMPVAGALADHSGRKREFLALYTYIAAAAVMAMYFVEDTRYQLGVVLFCLAGIVNGMAIVVYNAFLPEIATADERDAVSSRGWALGYLGGGTALALNLLLFLNHEAVGISEETAVRICLLSAGVWWAGFAFYSVRVLRNRIPPPAGEGSGQAVRNSLRQLGRTLADMRTRPVTLLFLLAYLTYSDGVSTVTTLAGTYAVEELELSQTIVIAAILLVQFVAFGGALLLGRLARDLGAKRVVLGALLVWIVVVLASYGLQTGSVVQFIALAMVIGLVMGGTQSLSRSLYSHLIPAKREAEYFGFYEITDKGTSWLGPLAFGIALQLTGSYRSAIASLLIFFVLGFVLLLMVDMRRGIEAVGNRVPERI